MKFHVDEHYLLNCFKEFVSAPSPVEYSEHLSPLLERYAAQFGHTVPYDGRERTHMPSLKNTMNLMMAYVLDI